jgi:tetratricopeptide (TPR) repeat protein
VTEPASEPAAGDPTEPTASGRVLAAAATILPVLAVIAHRLPVILLALLAGVVGYVELRGERIVMEPFEVPAALRDRGYTSQMIAHRLSDQMTRIRTVARTSMERKRLVSGREEPYPQIVIPGAGVSVESVVRYVGEVLGREVPTVSGEIVLIGPPAAADPEVEMTSRVSGRPARSERGRLGALDQVLFRIAEHIYQSTQPYLVASYHYESDRARCLEAIRFVLEHAPREDDARAWNLWGLVLRDEGRLAEAARKFERAVAVPTKDDDIKGRAYTNWADVLRRQQRYPDALATIQRAVEHAPTHANAYDVWGLILADLGETDAAIEAYRRAVARDPDHAEAHYHWGLVLAGRPQPEPAIEHFQRAVDIEPRFAAAHEALATVLVVANRLDEAAEHLTRAIELMPRSAHLHDQLGRVLLQQDRPEAARAAFDRARRLAARDGTARSVAER